jgi:vitamin B12 transporter
MRFLLLMALLAPGQAPDTIAIAGSVRDVTGLPLPGASIELGGRLVAVADDRGQFTVALPAGTRSTISVSLPGFGPRDIAIVAAPGVRLDVALDVAGVSDRVTVAAQPPEVDVRRPFSLEAVQIYRAAGAQADVFRALQTLPGVAAPDEGAGLFVRGGDVSEIVVSLDDAVIAHPYRYETPTGGFRGAVDPLQLAGLSFATGGFPARYGNVLSGVVDLRGLEPPAARETSLTAGLAGASASIGAPIGSRGGARTTINRTFTSVLFAVNGSPRRFEPAPEGWDVSASGGIELGRAGRVKAFALVQRDAVSVEIEQDAFAGLLRSASRHQFVSARWDGRIGGWTTFASLARDGYERSSSAGVLDLTTDDRVQSWGVDASRGNWRLGLNGAWTRTDIRGLAPQRGGDLSGISGQVPFDARVSDSFAGAYLESTMTVGRVTVSPGVRADRFGIAHATTADPRVNVRIALAPRHAVRLATGVYHQTPAASYFDRLRGASRLSPMRAEHYVAGYEAGREAEGLYLRVEGYVKQYRELPLEAGEVGYTSSGHGSAHGVDTYAQWRREGLELRGSVSWLRATRRWTAPGQQERHDLPDGTWTPDFAIPWSAQMLAVVPLAANRSLGLSWRSAAGRPHTPVVDALATGAGFAPVFGPINSERLPRYERLDTSFNWLVPAGDGVVILFAALDNALGRANARGFVYSADYSTRRLVVSNAPRSIYAGVTFRR